MQKQTLVMRLLNFLKMVLVFGSPRSGESVSELNVQDLRDLDTTYPPKTLR